MRIRKPNRVTTPRDAVLGGTRESHASMPRARGRWRHGPRRLAARWQARQCHGTEPPAGHGEEQ